MTPNPNSPIEQAAVQPGNGPFTAASARSRHWLAVAAVTAGMLGGAIIMSTGSASAAWQGITQFLTLHGKPEPASANVLSEHEIELLDRMTPQSQADLLLERSINHYRGANDQIAERVPRWRGKLELDKQLRSLFMTALNSDDLRVRAAGIEIDLASRDLEKNPATIDALEHDARFGEQGSRANALWDISLLANRGIEPGRAAEILMASIHDQNENIRYWAVEGLAYLGTDESITPLLRIFHDDPSPAIRERAACGLAQSGMLSEKQRRSAVPQLLDFADDKSLDAETQKWVFQALRDITGQTLPHDATSWRNWYNSSDRNWAPVTHDSE